MSRFADTPDDTGMDTTDPKGQAMNTYSVRVTVAFADGSTHEFLTGDTATDLNEAWAHCATRYTGEGSEWYPTARLVSLTITPNDPMERVPVPPAFR